MVFDRVFLWFRASRLCGLEATGLRSALGFQGSGLACFLVLALDSRKAQGGEHPGVKL